MRISDWSSDVCSSDLDDFRLEMDGHERHQITVGAKIDVKLLGPPRGGIGQLPMYRMVRNDLDVPLAIEVGKYPAAQRRNLLPTPTPDWLEQKSRNQTPTSRDCGRRSQFCLNPPTNPINPDKPPHTLTR